jgi:hypothetical protein
MRAMAVGTQGDCYVHLILDILSPTFQNQWVTNESVSSCQATAELAGDDDPSVTDSGAWVLPNLGYVEPTITKLVVGQRDVSAIPASERAQLIDANDSRARSGPTLPDNCKAVDYPSASNWDWQTVYAVVGEFHNAEPGVLADFAYGGSGYSDSSLAVGLSVSGGLSGLTDDGLAAASYRTESSSGTGAGFSTPTVDQVRRQMQSKFIDSAFEIEPESIGRGGDCSLQYDVMTWATAWVGFLYLGAYTVGQDGKCTTSKWGGPMGPGGTAQTYSYSGQTYSEGMTFFGISGATVTGYGTNLSIKWAADNWTGWQFWLCGDDGPITGDGGSPKAVYAGPNFCASSSCVDGPNDPAGKPGRRLGRPSTTEASHGGVSGVLQVIRHSLT